MKKTVFFGLLVILLAFGFVGCGDGGGSGGGGGGGSGSGGTLTINNIPAAYENKYAHFRSYIEAKGVELWGVKSVSMSDITLVQIKNGSVSLSMWQIANSGAYSRYSGNDNITNSEILIFEFEKMKDNEDLFATIKLSAFTFSGGNANRTLP